jgi:hypothetical protein
MALERTARDRNQADKRGKKSGMNMAKRAQEADLTASVLTGDGGHVDLSRFMAPAAPADLDARMAADPTNSLYTARDQVCDHTDGDVGRYYRVNPDQLARFPAGTFPIALQEELGMRSVYVCMFVYLHTCVCY